MLVTMYLCKLFMSTFLKLLSIGRQSRKGINRKKKEILKKIKKVLAFVFRLMYTIKCSRGVAQLG